MALRHLDGFDHYVTADLPTMYTLVTTAPTISAGTGRNGTASLRCTDMVRGWGLTLDAQGTWIVGFSWNTTALGAATILSFWDGAVQHVTFALQTDGTIKAFRGTLGGTLLATSTAVIAPGTTYYLEFKVTISDTVGVAQLRVNGVLDATLNFSGDTRNGGNATANLLQYQSLNNLGATTNQDDLYILDGTVGDSDQPNNDFWGDIRVELSSVGGAGATTQWTPSASTNASNVDDAAPDGDTTYNETSTVNQIDTFAMTNLVTTTGAILGFEVLNYAKKTTAGDASLAPVIRSGGVDYVGAGVALGTTYTYLKQPYDVNPATGLPATISEVNAFEAGYKKTV